MPRLYFFEFGPGNLPKITSSYENRGSALIDVPTISEDFLKKFKNKMVLTVSLFFRPEEWCAPISISFGLILFAFKSPICIQHVDEMIWS